MKKYVYILGLFLSGILSSCGSVEVLTYDQLRPAEISLPTEIRQVGVVNNMSQRAKAPSNDLYIGLLQGEGKDFTEVLAGDLADSKYFDQVIICDSALQDKNAEITIDPKLSVETVSQLASNLGVDLLISMEGLWVETAKKQIQYPGWDALIPALQATLTPLVRVYLPGRSQPLYTLSPSDSIYWDLGTPLSEKIVLDEATRIVAGKITNYLVPTWKSVDRVYFVGGCVEMRDASICMNEGDWQEAQNTWKGLYDRLRKGKTKARAAYNIALSYEMLGNIEEALSWIRKSEQFVAPSSQEEQLVKKYTEVLKSRMQEMVSLNSQMSRFNHNF